MRRIHSAEKEHIAVGHTIESNILIINDITDIIQLHVTEMDIDTIPIGGGVHTVDAQELRAMVEIEAIHLQAFLVQAHPTFMDQPLHIIEDDRRRINVEISDQALPLREVLEMRADQQGSAVGHIPRITEGVFEVEGIISR